LAKASTRLSRNKPPFAKLFLSIHKYTKEITMINIIISIIIVLAFAVLFGWLAKLAWGSRKAFVKWAGLIFGGLLVLILVLAAVLSSKGLYKLYAKNVLVPPDVTVQGTPDQIARGEHLAKVLCAGCHSTNGDLPLSGGKNLSADTGLPLGDIYAPNLTPATDIKGWSNADLFRAIRTGVDDQGRATAMTMVAGPHSLSDEDTLAVIAYLRQSPAVVHATPEFKPNILTALLAGAGMLPLNVPATVSVLSAPPKAATIAYGKYVMTFMDCTSCHGEKLDGVVPPPIPAGPDIRNYFSHWSKNDFFNVVHAFSVSAQPSDVMPWKHISRMDDVELEALYLYLHQVTSK